MRSKRKLTDEQRAKLLALAARRGEKRFSRIVQHAVDDFLAKQRSDDCEERKRRTLAAMGSLTDREADEMRAVVREMRKTWRTS